MMSPEAYAQFCENQKRFSDRSDREAWEHFEAALWLGATEKATNYFAVCKTCGNSAWIYNGKCQACGSYQR